MKKISGILLIVALLLGSVFLFYLIYYYFQVRLPQEGEDVLLRGDWLAFLGDYLGFASSTLLAIAVFKQDAKINDLISNEYDPVLIFSIAEFERIREIEDAGNPPLYLTNEDVLYTQYVFAPVERKDRVEKTDSSFCIFLRIQSKGKLPVRRLMIEQISIDNGLVVYKEDIDGEKLLKDKIQPNGNFDLCLRLKEFPHFEGNDVHELTLKYSVNVIHNVVYKDQSTFLLQGDESMVFDGSIIRNKDLW